MTTPQDGHRPEHAEEEAEVQQGQVSESSDLGDTQPIGDADATDKSTGTAAEEAGEPDA